MNLSKLNLNALKKKQTFVLLGVLLLLLFVYYLWVYLYEIKLRCENQDPNNPSPLPALCKFFGWVPKPPFYGTKDNIVDLLIAVVIPVAMLFVGVMLVATFPIVGAVLLLGGLIIGAITLYLNATPKPDNNLPDNNQIPN